MGKKSISKNYIYNLIYQILVLILPLITTPYISRVLGAENIGIYGYTISIVTYFILFGSLGIVMYGQREIAYVQNEKDKYSKIFWEIIILRLITMSISMMIFYFIFARNGEYITYYRILLLEMLANCIDISWFFQGMEEFKKIVLRNMFMKLIIIVCIFIFVKSSNDLIIYFWLYVLSTFLGNLSLWAYLPKYITKVKIKELKVFRHLKPTIALFIPQIAIQVYTVLDKTMIGSIISDKAEVGYYEQSQKVIKMLLTVITSLGTVMIPRMANIFASGDNEKIKQYMNKTFNFVYIISIPMIFGIISISTIFVPLFFGEGYEKVTILMNVISPILLAIGLSSAIGNQYFLPTKRQKKLTISVVIGALTNFIINLMLIKRFGAIGASIGTVIAEITVIVVQMYLIRKEFDVLEMLKMSRNYLLAGIIMFIINVIIFNTILINLNRIMALCIIVLVGIVIYITILLLLKDEFLKNILKLTLEKINTKIIRR